ncbi:mechanosensitive ion channel family protein [Rhodospirillaceae bacterium KN72]|uniref:Mechanosensitive ion channel family protein n=1 Tax=Pacificispira spongiicola TaxID=2729598 RepID=A0A7Y0HEF5_9PROT|nr:mechanosensitive ion channel domain-containing protein [Pacificispira spongiicola]NMM44630.1 mechanosensitive ion channel family protein [Pacificispira spongiicola]
MTRRFLAAFLFLTAILVSPFDSAFAQSNASESTALPANVDAQMQEWNNDLNVLETMIRNPDLSNDIADSLKRTLSRIISSATQLKNTAESERSVIQSSLEALGPPPEGENATPEPEPVAAERTRLNDALAERRAESSLADLTIARATSLEARIGETQRTQLAERLMAQGDLPYDPDVIAEVPRGIGLYLARLGLLAAEWWKGIPEHGRGFAGLFQSGVIILIGLAVGWWLRTVLLKRLGPQPVTEQPPYIRRLIAAIADGVAKGILPSVVLVVIIIRTKADSTILYGDFGAVIGLAAVFLMVFVLVTALPHAVLSPDDDKWRLTSISQSRGRRIMNLVSPLALLFCIDAFVSRTAEDVPAFHDVLTPGFLSFWTFAFNLAQGGFALALMRPSLWIDPPATDVAAADDGSTPTDGGGVPKPFWKAVHTLLIVLTVIGTVAPALGYINLGNYLLNNLLGSAVLASILFILRGLFRDLIGMAVSSVFIREQLALQHKTRSRIKFMARFVMDIALIAIGVSLVAPSWGISETDLLRAVRTVFGGLKVGSVTISPTDILLSILVFTVALALIRALKRNLAEKILPETEIEEGLRHSITAGIGYIGFVVAAGLAVAVAGVDLTNIALIAGALSVGIGFGLQNIVNNFVSGLILLIERPIKVGDWVVVGSNEGMVKQINMRATEIETWQRASVIVPNADLLSQSLKNWTHKDKMGRVDISVGVAYDSDIDKVCAVMLDIAKAHPRARRFPEPFVLVTNFGDSQIDVEVRMFTSDILYVAIIGSEIRREILRRFHQEGISIPFPQRVLHFTREEAPVVETAPASELDMSGKESTDGKNA